MKWLAAVGVELSSSPGTAVGEAVARELVPIGSDMEDPDVDQLSGEELVGVPVGPGDTDDSSTGSFSGAAHSEEWIYHIERSSGGGFRYEDIEHNE